MHRTHTWNVSLLIYKDILPAKNNTGTHTLSKNSGTPPDLHLTQLTNNDLVIILHRYFATCATHSLQWCTLILFHECDFLQLCRNLPAIDLSVVQRIFQKIMGWAHYGCSIKGCTVHVRYCGRAITSLHQGKQ